MRFIKQNNRPAPKRLIEFMEKEARGEFPPRYPDEKPVFITEEMEAEALAKGITEFTKNTYYSDDD
ncbi:hypothetical protein [Oligella urethralis]|uniref:Uncharacterized protein n=1 Tax=Oligella urethralis TaxID=90245 RepID=A0A2X1UMY1_9BURK|nr:hypothetical protein [Oligella urethralis]SPY08447.1 Uncharacterised protein [Oligella urethralis]